MSEFTFIYVVAQPIVNSQRLAILCRLHLTATACGLMQKHANERILTQVQ